MDSLLKKIGVGIVSTGIVLINLSCCARQTTYDEKKSVVQESYIISKQINKEHSAIVPLLVVYGCDKEKQLIL